MERQKLRIRLLEASVALETLKAEAAVAERKRFELELTVQQLELELAKHNITSEDIKKRRLIAEASLRELKEKHNAYESSSMNDEGEPNQKFQRVAPVSNVRF